MTARNPLDGLRSGAVLMQKGGPDGPPSRADVPT